MEKITKIERAGNVYTLSDPNYYFDQYGQIIGTKTGTEIIGCPHCGAPFAESCFCGFVTNYDLHVFDEYDFMFQSAYDWNAEHNPSANW